jgi:CRISPR/Cas system-associated exonuclease Cas4 (RecB family)
MTEYMPAVSRSIVCNHKQKVQECELCNALLPNSFWNRIMWQRFQTEPNTYHVSTLANCLAKAYFERISPTEEPIESAWAKLRGTMLHYVVRSLGWSELAVKLQFELDGENITIAGHVDAFEPGSATVYDLKTTRFVKWQAEKGFIPRENHIAQVQCYYTLLDLYGIPVQRLVLVYVDDQTILPKQVPLGSRKEWMIDRATALHLALLKEQAPDADVGSGCVYCPFIRLCPRSAEATRVKEVKK